MDSITFQVVIEACVQTEVLVLPLVVLNRIMKDNPYVELFIYKEATDKFSEVMWTMQQILFQKIDGRVASFLLEEVNHSKDDTIIITHDKLARYIGSAREVVSRVLKYMEEEELIALDRGKITVLDKEGLTWIT